MDWANVTAGELVGALKEVEWSSAPRPLAEFFQKFTPPKNAAKWQSRVKCNVYYYRTNYLIIIYLTLLFSFLRNPVALAAAILSFLAVACLNDRRTGVRGRPLRGSVYICGQDRNIIVGLLAAGSLYLWYASRGLYTVFIGLFISKLLVAAHASFRSPNLKARLNSFREDFRAVWRGYREAP